MCLNELWHRTDGSKQRICCWKSQLKNFLTLRKDCIAPIYQTMCIFCAMSNITRQLSLSFSYVDLVAVKIPHKSMLCDTHTTVRHHAVRYTTEYHTGILRNARICNCVWMKRRTWENTYMDKHAKTYPNNNNNAVKMLQYILHSAQIHTHTYFGLLLQRFSEFMWQ